MTRTNPRNLISAILISLAFALTPSSAAHAQPSGVPSTISASWFSRATLRGVLIATWHHFFAEKVETETPVPSTWDGSSWEPLGGGG